VAARVRLRFALLLAPAFAVSACLPGDLGMGWDVDGDGFGAGEDCEPDDPDAHPYAAELCDGIDNNCDGQVDEGCYSAISAGAYFSCGVINEEIVCWGTPSHAGVCGPPALDVDFLDSGTAHSCALAVGSPALCWGDDSYEQLDAPDEPLAHFDAGFTASCGITIDGRVTCWGDERVMTGVPDGGGHTLVSVGRTEACALDAEGRAACWGPTDYIDDAPAGPLFMLDLGAYHACGLVESGEAVCWGCLGEDDKEQCDPPAGTFRTLSAGEFHTCGLRSDGSVDCWGSNSSEQLDVPDGQFVDVDAGWQQTCVLSANGTAACFGHLSTEEVPDTVDEGYCVTTDSIGVMP
jgi:hypothetical protein